MTEPYRDVSSDVIVISSPPSDQLGPALHGIDLAVARWLHAKYSRSQSKRTRTIYTTAITRFRATLQQLGLDLDSDPERITLAAQLWVTLPWRAEEPDEAVTQAAGEGTSQRRRVQSATVNQRRAVLSSFYAFAIKHKLLPYYENPIAPLEKATVQPNRGARSLPPGLIQRQVQQIDRATPAGRRDYALLGVFLATSRRLSEVAGLRWGDVRIEEGTVYLHFRRTKGGEVLIDALPEAIGSALLVWLRSYYGEQLDRLSVAAPLWVSLAQNKTGGHPLTIRAIADICKKHFGTTRVHMLRHTVAREMERAGAKVSEIQARLGHKSLATTDRYLADLRRAENPYASELVRAFGFDS